MLVKHFLSFFSSILRLTLSLSHGRGSLSALLPCCLSCISSAARGALWCPRGWARRYTEIEQNMFSSLHMCCEASLPCLSQRPIAPRGCTNSVAKQNQPMARTTVKQDLLARSTCSQRGLSMKRPHLQQQVLFDPKTSCTFLWLASHRSQSSPLLATCPAQLSTRSLMADTTFIQHVSIHL